MAVWAIIGSAGALVGLFIPQGRDTLRRYGLVLAAVVAVLATASSLYLSEIAGLEPCRYCWMQRIFMYPMAVILPIAIFRRDFAVRIYGFALAGIGLAISVYHSYLQLFPPPGGSCDPSNPCTLTLVKALGFFTIPMMTGMCFVAIIISLALARPSNKVKNHE